MKQRNGLLVALGVGVVALLLVYLLDVRQKGDGTLPADEIGFAVDSNQVVGIRLSQVLAGDTSGQIRLVKEGPNQWTLNERYQPSLPRLAGLMRVLHTLAYKQTLPEAGRKHARTLIKQDHILVELDVRGGPDKTYYLGPATADGLGNYIWLEGARDPYVAHIPLFQGYPRAAYNTVWAEWRAIPLFQTRPQDLTEVSVAYPGADSSFTLIRNNQGAWQLADGSPTDSLALRRYLERLDTAYAQAAVEDRPQAKLDSLATLQPMARLRLRHRNGQTTVLRLHAQPSNTSVHLGWLEGSPNPELLLIQEFVVGPLLRQRSFFAPVG